MSRRRDNMRPGEVIPHQHPNSLNTSMGSNKWKNTTTSDEESGQMSLIRNKKALPPSKQNVQRTTPKSLNLFSMSSSSDLDTKTKHEQLPLFFPLSLRTHQTVFGYTASNQTQSNINHKFTSSSSSTSSGINTTLSTPKMYLPPIIMIHVQ